MQSLPRNGAMAAVFAGEDRVRSAIAPYTESVSIAATNSPLNTVISGKADDVRAVLERLAKEGMEAKPLAVSHAFHSPLVEPILDEFEQFARSVEHHVPVVDLVLNVTGGPLERSVAAGCRILAQTRSRNGQVRGIDSRIFTRAGFGPFSRSDRRRFSSTWPGNV